LHKKNFKIVHEKTNSISFYITSFYITSYNIIFDDITSFLTIYPLIYLSLCVFQSLFTHTYVTYIDNSIHG